MENIESLRQMLIQISDKSFKDKPKLELITIDELNSIAPQLDWTIILSRLYDSDRRKGFNGSELVMVTHRDYLVQLNRLLVDQNPG